MTAGLNLASLDLNLMVVFDAIMKERQLSRAGSRVGLSQPAMSHALRRLRDMLDDELFVRGAGGMEPTPRALELADPIGIALDRLRTALTADPPFDPATATQSFNLTMSDASAVRLLSRLIPVLRAQAPGIDIHIITSGAREGVEHVLSGAADLGIGVFPHLSDRLRSEVVFKAKLVCIADAANPAIQTGLDIERFLALPHVGNDVGTETGANIDSLFDTMGLKRRVMVHVSHFMAVTSAVIGSDLLAVVPESLVREDEKRRLKIFELPFTSPTIGVRMVWRARQTRDPASMWLRHVVCEAMSQG